MPDLLQFIVVSACLGALIGLIRQWGEQADRRAGDFAGVRTHTFWALLGCLGAYASEAHAPFAFLVVLVLVAAHLMAQAAHQPQSAPGSTSLAGAILTIFCGALVFWEETKSAVLVAATTMVLMGTKQGIHTLTRGITRQDIHATLQFVAISGVILPLVPNRDLGPYGAFNPFSTWLMVVLISGLGFAGYIAIRIVGAGAGILLTGLLGGLASSTASTLAFSRRSAKEPGLADHYSLAVIAACTVMLPRVLVATGLVNREFTLSLLVPFGLMAIPGIAFAAYLWLARGLETRAGDTPELANPLGLSTAIKFAAFYAVIAFGVKVIRAEGWTQGLLPLSFVSGLADMIAISLSVARDHEGGNAESSLATQAVVLAAISNTLLKAGMAVVLGSTGLKWRVAIVLGATAAIGAGWMWLGSGWSPFGAGS